MLKKNLILLLVVTSMNVFGVTTKVKIKGHKGNVLDDLTNKFIIHHTDEDFAMLVDKMAIKGVNLDLTFKKESEGRNFVKIKFTNIGWFNQIKPLQINGPYELKKS